MVLFETGSDLLILFAMEVVTVILLLLILQRASHLTGTHSAWGTEMARPSKPSKPARRGKR